jgi:hypothetical protein
VVAWNRAAALLAMPAAKNPRALAATMAAAQGALAEALRAARQAEREDREAPLLERVVPVERVLLSYAMR